MNKINEYIQGVIKILDDRDRFKIGVDDYIDKGILTILLERYFLKNIDEDSVEFWLTQDELEDIIQQAEIITTQQTVDFLVSKKVLKVSRVNESTGNHIYMLTKKGKKIHRKIIS